MKNIPLFIFDFIFVLPITLIRLLIIYFMGSKYNLPSMGFLDVMVHANNKYFNQEDISPSIDTLKDDIRVRINYDSRCNKDILIINKNTKCNKCDHLLEIINNKNNDYKKHNTDNVEKNNDSIEDNKKIDNNNEKNIKINNFDNTNNKFLNNESVFKKKTNIKEIVEESDIMNVESDTQLTSYSENDYKTENHYKDFTNTEEFNKYRGNTDDLLEKKHRLLILLDKINS